MYVSARQKIEEDFNQHRSQRWHDLRVDQVKTVANAAGNMNEHGHNVQPENGQTCTLRDKRNPFAARHG